MIYKKILLNLKPKFIPRTIRCVFSSFLSSPRALSRPMRLGIENSAGCNLRCSMCVLDNIKRSKGFIIFENFKKIYDQIMPPYLNLTGIGEGFLNKDIFKIIKYAKSKGSFIKLDSNATIMNSEIIDKIINSGLDNISISIDGSNKEIYSRIRVGGDFNVVVDNLKQLIKIRNERKAPLEICVAIVAQKDNIADIINIIKLADRLGVDEINPTPVIEYDLKKNDKIILKNVIPELEKVCAQLSGLKTKASLNAGPLIKYLDDYKRGNLKYKKESCFAPWYNVYITWEGDVVPCCYFYDKQIVLGNVLEENFKKIWNNKKYRDFRKKIANNRESILCQTCRNHDVFLEKKFRLLSKIPFVKYLSRRRYK